MPARAIASSHQHASAENRLPRYANRWRVTRQRCVLAMPFTGITHAPHNATLGLVEMTTG
jgi:hypothetical protein